MNCNCKSYNLDGDGSTDEVLQLPDWVDTARQNRTVCVDACIAKVILYLWQHGIETLGCCCGHNKEKPNVVVGSGVSAADDVYGLIANVDDREWDVLQWQLARVKEVAPACGNDGTKWNRPDCEYDEQGVCIHCGEEIPF